MAIQILRGTSSQRQSSTQVLAAGQPFYETDTGKLFISNSSSTVKSLTDGNSFTPTNKFKATSGAVSSSSELPTPQPNTLYKVEYATSSGSRQYDLVWTNRTLSTGASGLNGKVSISSSGTWIVSDGSPISWSAISGDNLVPPDPMDTSTSIRSAADFEIYFDDSLGVFKVVTTSKTDYTGIEIVFAAVGEDMSTLDSISITLPPMGMNTTSYIAAGQNSSKVASIEDVYGLVITMEDTLGRLTAITSTYSTSDSVIQSLDLETLIPSITGSDYTLKNSTTLQIATYENSFEAEETLYLCKQGLLKLWCYTGTTKNNLNTNTELGSDVDCPVTIKIPSTSLSSDATTYIRFRLTSGNLAKDSDWGSSYTPSMDYVDRIQY